MNIIWANRLIAGTKTWAEMPASRRAGVKKVLAERVNKGEITAEDYKRITGDDYDVARSVRKAADPAGSAGREHEHRACRVRSADGGLLHERVRGGPAPERRC